MLRRPISRAGRATKSTSATSSLGGSVLGRAAIVVTPPAAAAWLAETMFSMCSAPGSRSWTRMSTRPGARRRPAQSTAAVAGGASRPACGPSAAMNPSRTRISPGSSRPLAGSRIRALRKRVAALVIARRSRQDRPVAEVARQKLEAGHAHGDAHLDLLADDAAVDVVGDFAIDLDAAIHRPGMHDEGVGLG